MLWRDNYDSVDNCIDSRAAVGAGRSGTEQPPGHEGEFTVAEAVSNYKVGFQITSKKGAWIYIDTLTLTKKASDSAEETPAPEATESPDPTATPETSATPEPESNVLYSKTFEEGTDPADMSDWSQTWSVDSSATSIADTGAGNNTTNVWNYYSATAQNLTAATTVTASDAGNYKASFLTAGENVTGTISLTAGDRKVSADLTAGIAAFSTSSMLSTNRISIPFVISAESSSTSA